MIEIAGMDASGLLELALWTGTILLALWRGWLMVAVTGTMAFPGPMVASVGGSWPLEFKGAVVLLLLTLWLEYLMAAGLIPHVGFQGESERREGA